MTERIIEANGVDLCVETFGSPDDPAVLLIHGACASMLWWQTELCERLAARGRYVIRYDNRDTGRSVSYLPGRPGYTMSDLARDAVGILDALGVDRAHVVGRSMSGGIALIIGLDHPDRVSSLTFVATTPGDGDLPPDTADYPEYAENADYVVGVLRAYAGASPFFDADAVRTLAEQDIARTRDLTATLTNHFAMTIDGPAAGGFGDLTAPVLIVHGDLDPVHPLPHALALHAEVPGSRLLVLEGAGHDLPREQWDTFVEALVK